MKPIRIFALCLFSLSLFALPALAQTEEPSRDVIKKYEAAQAPGLQVTIFLQQENGALTPVDPQREFHQGERVKVKVESNFRGYLYIINHGASGKKNLIFPDGKESNLIQPRATYLAPGTYDLVFDEKAGFETLQVIVARKRLASLDAALKQPDGELNAAQTSAIARFWSDSTPDQAGITQNQDNSRDPAFDKKKKITTAISSANKANRASGRRNFRDQPTSVGIKLKNSGARQ